MLTNLEIKRKNAKRESEEDLPSEIVIDVLSRVDVKSFIRFRNVSKSWNNLVTDPLFVAVNMNRTLENNSFKFKLMIKDFNEKLYSLDYEEGLNYAVVMEHPMSAHITKVYGSCNGLLCTTRFDSDLCVWNDLCIWNPSTGKSREVPFLSYRSMSKFIFWYNQDIDDYEVVRIYTQKVKDFTTVVDVYSLRRNSWKTIHLLSLSDMYDEKDKLGVFVEGSHHWVVHGGKVIAFDSGRENFISYVPLPKFDDDTSGTSIHILEYGGKLLILSNIDRKDSELWVMKFYGVKESWTKLFNILAHLISCSLFCLKMNGSVLMKGDNLDVILYDQKLKHEASSTLQAYTECKKGQPILIAFL